MNIYCSEMLLHAYSVSAYRNVESQSDCSLQDPEDCGQKSVPKISDASLLVGRASEAEPCVFFGLCSGDCHYNVNNRNIPIVIIFSLVLSDCSSLSQLPSVNL